MKTLKIFLITFSSLLVVVFAMWGVCLAFKIDKEKKDYSPVNPPTLQLTVYEGYLTYELSQSGLGYVLTTVNPQKAGKLVIPKTINNKPVVKVDLGALNECEKITEIVVNADINLPNDLFSYVNNLQKLTIPNTKTAIFQFFDETDRYSIPTSLKEVVYNATDSVTQFECAPNPFLGCYNVEKITINAKNLVLDQALFEDCHALKTLVTSTSEIRSENLGFFAINSALSRITLTGESLTITAQNALQINPLIFGDCNWVLNIEIVAPNAVVNAALFENCNENAIIVVNGITY